MCVNHMTLWRFSHGGIQVTYTPDLTHQTTGNQNIILARDCSVESLLIWRQYIDSLVSSLIRLGKVVVSRKKSVRLRLSSGFWNLNPGKNLNSFSLKIKPCIDGNFFSLVDKRFPYSKIFIDTPCESLFTVL